MADNENIPRLTLSAEDEAEVIEAPAFKLVTSPIDGEAELKKAEDSPLNMNQLTEAERRAVLEFSEKIDVTDSNVVLTYGAAAQKHVSDFSEGALKNLRTKDLGAVGEAISGLVSELRSMDFRPEEKRGLRGLFKKAENQLEQLKSQYTRVEVNVGKIAESLERHQIQLLKDIAVFDKMYEMNLGYFKELTMYILAGKNKVSELRGKELPELMEKAKSSGLPEDAQAANDFRSMIDRFEKKLYDLELTRTVSIQMAPQIRLLQNNDSMMVEKIQTSIVNTIPLWKSQMVLALGIAHSQQAMEAQRAVTDMTNELLRKNADALKTGTVAAAREAERGIVDIETLQHTNQALIETLDEVRRIQEEGARRRGEAETELTKIEGELKRKLLELRDNAQTVQE